MPPTVILVLLLLTTSFAAIPRIETKVCTRDSDCKAVSFYGLSKLDSGNQVADTKDGKCCTASGKNGFCYYDELDTCTQQDDLADSQKFTVCPTKGSTACGLSCCDKYTERCEKYSEKNGFVVASCVLKLNNRNGFWIVGLPIILTILTIIGLLATLLISKGRMAEFGKGEKIILALSLLIAFLGIVYYYSSAWQYGVTIATSAGIGIVTLAASYRPLSWFNLYVQVALFLALLGWGTGNFLWGNWGAGILSPATIFCSARYEGYFARSAATSNKWSSPAAAVRADMPWSLIGSDWGYCDSDWFVALWVFGAIVISLSAILLAGHAALLVHAATKM